MEHMQEREQQEDNKKHTGAEGKSKWRGQSQGVSQFGSELHVGVWCLRFGVWSLHVSSLVLRMVRVTGCNIVKSHNIKILGPDLQLKSQVKLS